MIRLRARHFRYDKLEQAIPTSWLAVLSYRADDRERQIYRLVHRSANLAENSFAFRGTDGINAQTAALNAARSLLGHKIPLQA